MRRRWIFAAVFGAYLALVGWSIAARAGEMVPTVTVLHETPGIAIEGEVRGLGLVQLNPLEQGTTGGVGWASLAVLADVGPVYEIRVRARAGQQVSPWSEWRTLAGPVAETCSSDDGAIGLDDLGFLLGKLSQPGQVCVR